MNEPLRPLTLGEILDRTFQIYRARFLVFVTLATLPALVMMSLQFANLIWWKLTLGPFGTRTFLGMTVQSLLYALALYHVSLLIRLLVWPAFSNLTSHFHLGEQPTLSSALLCCIARWRSWLGMTVASWGIVLVLPELVVAGLFIGVAYLLFGVMKVGDSAMDLLVRPMFFVTIVLSWAAFLWLSSALSISFPAWIIERLTVGKCLKRSWILSKDSCWRILFARFMIAIVGWILNFASYVILLFLAAFVMGIIGARLDFPSNIDQGIKLFSAAVTYMLIGPIFPIALTLFYYDQRIRYEGYDIERMMEAAGMSASVSMPTQTKEGPA